jgi:hypothetical protein
MSICMKLCLTGAGLLCQLNAQEYDKLNFNVGAGVSAPVNPTAAFAGVSANFVAGAGYNLNKKNSLIGEFMWSGLPPNFFVLHPVGAPSGHINLYTLTGNYRYHIDRVRGGAFGVYTIAGGGWYYRYSSIDKNYVVPPSAACLPVYTWWGYACDPNGGVYSEKVAYKGNSAGGLNGGVGFTLAFGDSGWKFYLESRYHYAFSDRVVTTLVPVTFGIRLN